MELKVVEYSRCQCGAITLTFDNGAHSSMRESTRKKLHISLRGARKMQTVYCCDHCVNHYGIDLCSCGSGKKVGKCDCGSTEPMQQLGVELDHIGRLFNAFRH